MFTIYYVGRGVGYLHPLVSLGILNLSQMESCLIIRFLKSYAMFFSLARVLDFLTIFVSFLPQSPSTFLLLLQSSSMIILSSRNSRPPSCSNIVNQVSPIYLKDTVLRALQLHPRRPTEALKITSFHQIITSKSLPNTLAM